MCSLGRCPGLVQHGAVPSSAEVEEVFRQAYAHCRSDCRSLL